MDYLETVRFSLVIHRISFCFLCFKQVPITGFILQRSHNPVHHQPKEIAIHSSCHGQVTLILNFAHC